MRNNYLFKTVLTAALLGGGLTVLNAQTPITAITRPVVKQTQNAANAQWQPQGDFHTCPSGRLTDAYIQENGLQALAMQARIEKENTSTEEPVDRAVRTVPVIFHIVYGSTAENVSDAVINNLLTRLNQDYRKNNSGIAGIRPSFTGVASDVQIEFCLATKDPNGNTLATPGITRNTTTLTYFDPDATNVTGNVGGSNSMKTAQYGAAPWDRTKYVNIWICDITNGANFGTAGYAYVPQGTTTAGLPPATIDGIVLDYNIGVEGGTSHAVSHEMGHYFGLDHTFGDPTGACNTTTASDDGFTDTPRIKDAFQNVYSSCNSATTALSCESGVLWQYENLMDYSNCFCMFTTQQANHMNAVLSGSRNSLNTSYTTSCAAPAPQVPVADFTGCNSSVPQNSIVTLTDASTGIPTSWSWSITPATGWSYVGGTSATSQNPQVQFTTLGTYSVALTATNAQGSNTKTSATCITVVAAAPCNTLSSAFTMGFETSESLTGWVVENTNGDQNTTGDDVIWGLYANQTGLTAHGGTQMIGYYYNDDATTSANDWFFTPCFSLQANQNYSISFWYRVADAQYPEKLRVKIGNTNASTAMTQTIVDLGPKTNTTWVQSTTTFTVGTAGSYNIGFQCYSDADEFLIAVDDINISALAAAPVANFTGCGTYSAGSVVTFTNTSTNSPTSNSWSITPGTGWSYTGGTSATSANPQVTFTTAGTYTVALTASNSAGSNTKTSASCVVVSAGQVAPVANFTGCGNYTTGSVVTFTNTSTNSPTTNSWSITPGTGWSYTAGTNANSASPQVTFTTAGTYTVALTASNGAGSNTKTSASCVVVSNGQVAPIANFLGCPGIINAGTTVTFANTSSNSPTSNSWSITPNSGWAFAGGTNATSTSIQVTFTGVGSYTVALTATNGVGTDTKTTSSCVVVEGSGIADVDLSAGVALYPNPTTGITTLSISNAAQYTDLRVNLYNAVGVLVYSRSGNLPSEISLDLSAYSQGIYFVEIRANEAVTTKRVILSR